MARAMYFVGSDLLFFWLLGSTNSEGLPRIKLPTVFFLFAGSTLAAITPTLLDNIEARTVIIHLLELTDRDNPSFRPLPLSNESFDLRVAPNENECELLRDVL